MEVNPRLWQWHGLAAACGVDLTRIAYQDLIGDPPPPATMNGRAGAGRSPSSRASGPRRSARPTSTRSSPATTSSRRSSRRPVCCDELARRRLASARAACASRWPGSRLRRCSASRGCCRRRLRPRPDGSSPRRPACCSRAGGNLRALTGGLVAGPRLEPGGAVRRDGDMFAVHGSIWLPFAHGRRGRARSPLASPRRPAPRLALGHRWLLSSACRRDLALVGRGLRRRLVLPPRPDPEARRPRIALAALARRVPRRRAAPRDTRSRSGTWVHGARRRGSPGSIRPPGRAARPGRSLLPLSLRARLRGGDDPLPLDAGRGSRRVLLQFALPRASLRATAARFVFAGASRRTPASRMLLLPALLAAVFAYVRAPVVGGAGPTDRQPQAGALTLTHPPHAALVVVVLSGFLVARALLVRRDLVPLAAALAAVIVPAGAVALWLLPVVRETAAHNPGTGELHRAFPNYRNEIDVFGLHRYRLKPELFGRAGIVSVAALALLPFAVFARRRLWAAFALGGMLAAFAVSLIAFVFPHFADAVSLSQARRIVGFSPAGDRARRRRLRSRQAARRLRPAGRPRCRDRAAAGVPRRLRAAVPPHAGSACLADLVGVRRRRCRPGRRRGRGRLAATRTERPVGGAGGRALRPAGRGARLRTGARAPVRREPLPPALVQALRARIPNRAVVFSDALTAYQLAAALPVYVNATPPIHSERHEGEPSGGARPRRDSLLPPRRPDLRAAPLQSRLAARRPHPRPPRALPAAAGEGTPTGDTFSTKSREGAARHAVLPAGGRRRRPAAAEVRDAPARARDRDARARAGRPEVAAPRRRSCAPPTQAWVHRARYLGPRGRGAAEELHGTERGSSGCACRRGSRAAAARPRRERDLER